MWVFKHKIIQACELENTSTWAQKYMSIKAPKYIYILQSNYLSIQAQ